MSCVTTAQLAKVPTMDAVTARRTSMVAHGVAPTWAVPLETYSPDICMVLLLLEALGAFLLLIFIVWWTMFSGRRKGELPEDVQRSDKASTEQDATPPPPER